MYCGKCGREIPNGSEFCPYCGSNLKDYNTQNTFNKNFDNANQSFNNNSNNNYSNWNNKEKKKGNIKISFSTFLIILVIVVLLLLIIVGGIILINSKKDTTSINKDTDHNYYTSTQSNTTNQDSNNISNTQETTIDYEDDTNINKMIQTYLGNIKWVKENLIDNKDFQFNSSNDSSQFTINLEVIKLSKENTKCIVITNVEGYNTEENETNIISISSNDEINIQNISFSNFMNEYKYFYDKTSNLFVEKTNWDDSITYKIYHFNNGKIQTGELKKLKVGAHEDIYAYFWNDKEVSEDEYNQIKGKYINEDISERDYLYDKISYDGTTIKLGAKQIEETHETTTTNENNNQNTNSENNASYRVIFTPSSNVKITNMTSHSVIYQGICPYCGLVKQTPYSTTFNDEKKPSNSITKTIVCSERRLSGSNNGCGRSYQIKILTTMINN